MKEEVIVKVQLEHSRLKDAVVEKAKADRRAVRTGYTSNEDINTAIKARDEFNEAVDELLAFEARRETE
jgi:hypothetical protein